MCRAGPAAERGHGGAASPAGSAGGTRHPAGSAGFTLVELLVVILIIGLLGAIALPSFMSQRQKAKDVAAKEGVLTARTAIETYATDNDGSYEGATAGTLRAIEPILANYTLNVGLATPDQYRVRVTSATGNRFRVRRYADGTITRPCTTAGEGGCPESGFW